MQEILRILADNQSLLEAVREHFLAEFTLDADLSLDDKQLGERVRLSVGGKQKVDQAIKKILQLRSVVVRKIPENPAR